MPMNMPAMAKRTLDWLDLGACRDEDPDLFFPITSAGPAVAQLAAAKAVCARCTVHEACLRYALEARQDHGVWGGMSEDERRAIWHVRDSRAELLAG
jgi:WhiB family transcriptional regulator, redox-sensing transcriptional regulator